MRILILGGNGMLGHKLYQIIKEKHFDTWVILRNNLASYNYNSIYNSSKVIDCFDISNLTNLTQQLNSLCPDVVINACGITIRRGVRDLYSKSIVLNSVVPHFLNEWVSLNNKYLIHFSTDCVFSGKQGQYTEDSIKDAMDIYGLSKSLGEVVDSKNALTLRGSMIGRELDNKTELLEWFLKQKNRNVKGYSEVIYSGITSVRMAKIVLHIINNYFGLFGLYNVSSIPITKLNLLYLFNDSFNVNATIEKDNSYSSRKILISDKLYEEIGLVKPSWPDLISELKSDSLIYFDLYK